MIRKSWKRKQLFLILIDQFVKKHVQSKMKTESSFSQEKFGFKD